MIKHFLYCTFALCLIVLIAFLFSYTEYKENKAIEMPNDIAIDGYFEKVNDNVVKIAHIVSSIDSRETADFAVYQLVEIADKYVELYNQLDVHPVTEKQAVDVLHSIWTRETILHANPSYKTLENEYIRLRDNNFFGSKSLQCMLSSYFVKEAGNALVWAFSLTSRLEYTYLLKAKSRTKHERNKDYVEEFIDDGGYTLTPHNDNLTLLFLDALEHSYLRGSHDTSGIITPLYTSVRGRDALFICCFCSNYEMNNNFISKLSPENYFVDNWVDYNPAALMKLNKNEALQFMGFYKKCVVCNQECYVYHLNKAFKSRFLIIYYENNHDYPHAIQLVKDLPLFIP